MRARTFAGSAFVFAEKPRWSAAGAEPKKVEPRPSVCARAADERERARALETREQRKAPPFAPPKPPPPRAPPPPPPARRRRRRAHIDRAAAAPAPGRRGHAAGAYVRRREPLRIVDVIMTTGDARAGSLRAIFSDSAKKYLGRLNIACRVPPTIHNRSRRWLAGCSTSNAPTLAILHIRCYNIQSTCLL